MRALVGLLCGIVFGIGLAMSGMTDTAKVLVITSYSIHYTKLYDHAAEVLVDGPNFHVVRRRQTLEELYTGESIPAW